MYTYKDRIKLSETDKRRNWTLPAIIDAMQNCVMFQLEDLGIGPDVLDQQNKALVVTSWQVKIFRLPTLFQQITVGTQVYGYKSATGLRHCMIWDEQNQLCVASHSLGAFIDIHTGRPLKTSPEEWEICDVQPQTPCTSIQFQEKRIPLPADLQMVEEFTVNIHHLDINNHMNNGQYVRIAYNYLPDGFQVNQFRVEYKKPAALGARVSVRQAQQEGLFCVVFSDQANQTFAAVEFSS
ncbi:hypothetical protein Ami103574_02340 [Aminipila butyrica]|uniref:Acyl-acp thioesterase n=1 Tax=Aminipila butyrica TaxID=433296 RepID=A0A858BSN4_9FIRM|nr:acyl-ACP thioesterase domain-containing protein [Aminipila butyrica]QIB68219.1 hypothetical protein Ami103574_02340 [Aminipila butyrica]